MYCIFEQLGNALKQGLRHRLKQGVASLMLMNLMATNLVLLQLISPAWAVDLEMPTSEIHIENNQAVLDLPTVVDLVVSRNLEVAIAKTQIGQGQGQLLRSIAPIMPSLTAEHSAERFKGGEIIVNETPVDLDRTTLRPTLTLDWQISTGLSPLFAARASYFGIQRARHTKDQTLQTELLETLKQYFAWLHSHAGVDTSRSALKTAETAVKVAEAKLEAGSATQLDVVKSQNELRKASIALLKSEKDVLSRQGMLLNVLNLPADLTLLPPQNQASTYHFVEDHWLGAPGSNTLQGGISQSELMQIAEENRPDVKALSALVKQIKTELYTAISELMPTVRVNAYLRGIGPQLDELRETRRGMLMFSVDLLRNLGFDHMGEIKTNYARVKEAMLKKEKQLNDIESEINQNYTDLMFYQQKLAVAEESMDVAQKAYRLAMVRQQTGFGIELESLKARDEYLNATLNWITAKAEWNIAQLKLLQSVGLLTPDRVKSSSASTPKKYTSSLNIDPLESDKVTDEATQAVAIEESKQSKQNGQVEQTERHGQTDPTVEDAPFSIALPAPTTPPRFSIPTRPFAP